MEPPCTYPKVLVINGDAFTCKTATGLTLTRLFAGWPSDRLACLYTSTSIKTPDWKACNRYWSMSPRDMISFWTPGPLDLSSQLDTTTSSAKSYKKPTNRKLFPVAALEEQVRSFVELGRYLVSPELRSWISEFQPDVIYSMLGSNRLMQLVLDIASCTSVPLVPHFMDDWPTTHYRKSILAPLLRRVLLSRLKAVLARAHEGFTIGEAMAEEYKRRYHIPFRPFMNCIETAGFSLETPNSTSRSRVRFAYIGGLHLRRWEALREIGITLKALNEEGCKAELLIYTHQKDIRQYENHLYIPPIMYIVGSLTPDEVLKVQAEADILIHVESFDPTYRQYTRYSVSTKIPEYMSTGKPIFAYGPEEVASIQYIKQSRCGVIATKKSQYELKQKLIQIIESPDLRAELGNQGKKTAYNNHNLTLQREYFRKCLYDIVYRESKIRINESCSK